MINVRTNFFSPVIKENFFIEYVLNVYSEILWGGICQLWILNFQLHYVNTFEFLNIHTNIVHYLSLFFLVSIVYYYNHHNNTLTLCIYSVALLNILCGYTQPFTSIIPNAFFLVTLNHYNNKC